MSKYVPLTPEEVLLAANVLSVQNLQGTVFDRGKLLNDAIEFAQEAIEAAREDRCR